MKKIYSFSKKRFLLNTCYLLLLVFFSSYSFAQVTIGNGTATQRYPFAYYYGYARTATIYTATEMNTVSSGGTITTISWYSGTANSVAGPTVIYLKQVGTTTAVASDTWANTITGATQVYTGTPAAWTSGWNVIDITDYNIAANQNLEILVECNQTGTGTGATDGTAFRYTAGPANSNAYWEADNTAPSTTPSARNTSRPNVILAGLTLPQAPTACATNTSPANNATGISLLTTLSWNAVASASSYTVYIGTNNPPVIPTDSFTTVSTTSVSFTGSPNTNYYWYVIPKNSGGAATGCSANLTRFTTSSGPANDNACGAISLTASPNPTCTNILSNQSTLGATAGAAACAGSGADDDIWYSFVATSTTHIITLTDLTTTPSGSSNDRVHQLYSSSDNTCTGTLTSIKCSDPETSTTSGLIVGNTYFVRVHSYGTNNFTTFNICVTAPPPPPANDLPSGAITLTVDANCTGAPYTNASATLSPNEPRISCKGSQTAGAIVWFKFVAPTGGFVRVSTDVTGNSLTDTKLGVFSAADTSLASFQIIACDDDNGVVLGNSSIVYVSGLTPGATYYVAVDHYNGASTGTFCVQVHTMTTAMMASGTCATAGQSNYPLAAYTGQLSMTSSTGLLIANVRATAALSSDPSYTPYANINTGAVRTDSLSRYYLDRNFRITNTTSGNYNVQFFFLNSELAALQAVSPSVTLASLNSTKVKNESQCNNNLVSGGVANDSLLTQVANGTANGISWVNVVTPGFSNFYLHQGNVPLPITFEYLKGKNAGTGNALNWKVNCTSASVTMVLERSADARKFDHIVTSITASQARCGQPFDATDATPLKGTNYYRLKMIDVDGKISYSPVVAILYGKAGAELVGIYPTVVRNEAYLSVTASRTTKMQIAISDMSGKVIRTMTENVVSGSSVLTINTNNIASGVYNITGMLDGVKTGTLRFVKE